MGLPSTCICSQLTSLVLGTYRHTFGCLQKPRTSLCTGRVFCLPVENSQSPRAVEVRRCICMPAKAHSRHRICHRIVSQSQLCRHDDEQLRNPKVMADPKKRPPIPRVHTDFSESSGPQRLQAVLPDEAEKLKQSRYAIIQVCCWLA